MVLGFIPLSVSLSFMIMIIIIIVLMIITFYFISVIKLFISQTTSFNLFLWLSFPSHRGREGGEWAAVWYLVADWDYTTTLTSQITKLNIKYQWQHIYLVLKAGF